MKNIVVRVSAGLALLCLAALMWLAAPPSTFARDPDPAKPSAAPARPAAASSTAPAQAKNGAAQGSAAVDSAATEKSTAKADSPDAVAEDPLEELAQRRAEIDARYAEVYLKIAELNLRSALDANARVPNTVAPAEVDRLRQIVRLANVQSKAADSEEGSNDESMTIENDNSQVKMAQEALRRTIAASNRAPGVVPRIELDRLRLLTELGRLQLAKDKVAAEEKKAHGELRKRFTQLEKQVKDLQAAVDRLSDRSSPVPAKAASLPPARSPETKKAKKP